MDYPLQQKHNRIKKRCFDIVASVFFLVVFCSWLFPVVMVISAIKLKGPVFFRQRRTGKDGKEFCIIKFRTLPEPIQSEEDERPDSAPQCSRWGQWLRRTSVDEVPQLLNVLAGQMSLVGPRPHMTSHNDFYADKIERYKDRLAVKPGMTGYAAVHGFRGPTPELWMMQKRVEHDLWYIEHWSLRLDLTIIALEFLHFFKTL